jgi:hypothetical protein
MPCISIFQRCLFKWPFGCCVCTSVIKTWIIIVIFIINMSSNSSSSSSSSGGGGVSIKIKK